MFSRHICALILALAAAAGPARAQSAEGAPPVVVELFTSQGCGSCLRANHILGRMARDPGVIALTYGVPYWDYLGWTDTLARPEYANRQRNYTRAMHLRGPYTPQFVISGVREAGAAHLENADSIVDELRVDAPPHGSPRVAVAKREHNGARIEIGASAAPAAPADVWLVEFEPSPYTVRILAGENAGRLATYFNVVRRVYRVGAWSGAAETLEYDRCFPQCAILVQAPDGGPILGAAATRRERR
jgi:hypothetical protein